MLVRPSRSLAIHPAPNDAPRSAILVLPGGGYGTLADHEGRVYAEWLSALGLHAFVLDYPVAPERHPRPLVEAASALAWIRGGDHGLDVDAGRVGVIGSSAGGHLAASLSVGLLDRDVSRPDFAVLCYPVVSFEHDPHIGSIRNLLGAAPTLEQRHALSPDAHVDERTPPTFVWSTANDDSVHPSNSLRYADALVRAGVPVELHLFPTGAHGVGLAQDDRYLSRWTGLCERWLRAGGWLGGHL